MTNRIFFHELAAMISGEVHTDALRRYMLSTDGSIFRKMPACVVYPKVAEDVVNTVRFAGEKGLSVHARGAGSGLCGAALGSGIILDFSKFMNRLIRIDEEKKTFECEPGYRFGELEAALKGKGLFFPPDPSSGEYASFGGMVATNASGAHSVKYGNVADYVADADIVLASGEMITLSEISHRPPKALPRFLLQLFQVYEAHQALIESGYPPIPCNVSGYNLRGLVKDGRLDLRRLFSGAEGTLGIATRLCFRLRTRPAFDTLVVAYFDDIVKAAGAVQKLLPMGPAGIEIMDKSLLNLARETEATLRDKIPAGIDNILLIEFDGAERQGCEAAAAKARALLRFEGLAVNAYTAVSGDEKEKFWAVRKAAVPILYKLKGDKKILALIEDAAVPIHRLTEYFKGLHDISNRIGVNLVLYGHIAKGLLHCRPLLNLKLAHDVARLRPLAEETFNLVHGLGGVVSGEHGDGRLRSAFIQRQYPDLYALFLKTKRLLDEKNLLNPEIITHLDPAQMQQDLRYGTAYRSRDVARVQLHWPENFAAEVEKCHGCSKCTTVTTATRMCPVYKFTRDEAAAPKAKANVLRALISGAVADRRLYESAFQLVMDQCANCGSCHLECPSNVNIPKMVMEAKARYVKRFGASLHARVVTRVEETGRAAGKIARPLGALMSFEASRKAGQLITGISARRPFPAFSAKPLFERIDPVEGHGDMQVLYFAGCFAGYMAPQIGEALIKVLTRMGICVITPAQHCCGLPAMSKGMVRTARRAVMKNLVKWGDMVHQVSHIVVSCSSCGYALMKDWADLFQDLRVRRVSGKVIHISRFINLHRHLLPPLKSCDALVAYHQPCHLKIQPHPESSLQLLSRIPGLKVHDLRSHCCGMIGSWGMADAHNALSLKIGSDMLQKLAASGAGKGVTDCPTCRLQMAQFSEKPIQHPVEVLAGRL